MEWRYAAEDRGCIENVMGIGKAEEMDLRFYV